MAGKIIDKQKCSGRAMVRMLSEREGGVVEALEGFEKLSCDDVELKKGKKTFSGGEQSIEAIDRDDTLGN